ncbi:MAG: histone deacetylase family protein [Promethearchaeota archaeon]
MKIIFHDKFYEYYTNDPAAATGRLEPIVKELKAHNYEFITPKPASEADILRAHTTRHLDWVMGNPVIYNMALLAAGGAIKASELAYEGISTFAIIRPPGHHASADSCWGFCYFNNISISLLYLKDNKKIQSAFILDFDLHTGDGNINILNAKQNILKTQILNPHSSTQKEYLEEITEIFNRISSFDIITASAGFDEYKKDWGGKLSTKAYNKIGKLMKDFSEDRCYGRRYALLEGGYYHEDFGINVHAFCKGFE